VKHLLHESESQLLVLEQMLHPYDAARMIVHPYDVTRMVNLHSAASPASRTGARRFSTAHTRLS
jgi:hypothetical protein